MESRGVAKTGGEFGLLMPCIGGICPVKITATSR
jgi:hypothetical protein